MKTLSVFWPELYFLALIGMILIPWPGMSAWSISLLGIAFVFVIQMRYHYTLLGGFLISGISLCLLLLDTQILNTFMGKHNQGINPVQLFAFGILINVLTIIAIRKMALRYKVINW